MRKLSLWLALFLAISAYAAQAGDENALIAVAQDARAAWRLPFVVVNCAQPGHWFQRALQFLVSDYLELDQRAARQVPAWDVLKGAGLLQKAKLPDDKIKFDQALVDLLMVMHTKVGLLCYANEDQCAVTVTLRRLTPMTTKEVQVKGTLSDTATFGKALSGALLELIAGEAPTAAPELLPAGVGPIALEALGTALLECDAGRPQEGLKQAEACIAAAPNWFAGYYAKARALCELDRLQEATQAVVEAVKRAPAWPAPKLLAIRILYLQGDYQGAVTTVFKYLQLVPGDDEALILGAASRWAQGESESGRAWLEMIAQSKPYLFKLAAFAATQRVVHSPDGPLYVQWVPYVLAPYFADNLPFSGVPMLRVVAPDALFFQVRAGENGPLFSAAEAGRYQAALEVDGQRYPLKVLGLLGDKLLTGVLDSTTFPQALSLGFSVVFKVKGKEVRATWQAPGLCAETLQSELSKLSQAIASALEAGWVYADSTRADLHGDRALLAVWARPSLIVSLRSKHLPVARNAQEKVKLQELLVLEKQQFSAMLNLVSSKVIIILTAEDGKPLPALKPGQATLTDDAGTVFSPVSLTPEERQQLADYLGETAGSTAQILAFGSKQKALFGRGAKQLTLVLHNVCGEGNRTFTWPLQVTGPTGTTSTPG